MRTLLAAIVAILLVLAVRSMPDRSAAPLDFVRAAVTSHRIVFLGDIHPLAEPKEVVRDLIAGQDTGSAIDLLALEVGADQQPVIDRYLATTPEDVTVLLANPRTLRAHWGASREYLGIYRAVYRWNAMHPRRPVRILAADMSGWPMPVDTERMAVGTFVDRDRSIAATIARALEAAPGARVLVFMGGHHGLKSIGGEVQVGATRRRFDRWFAGYLAEAGHDVYTILSDARQPTGHGATRVFDRLVWSGRGNFAIPIDAATDAIDEPIREIAAPGYRLSFTPSRFPLRIAADAMIVFTRTRPITVLDEG